MILYMEAKMIIHPVPQVNKKNMHDREAYFTKGRNLENYRNRMLSWDDEYWLENPATYDSRKRKLMQENKKRRIANARPTTNQTVDRAERDRREAFLRVTQSGRKPQQYAPKVSRNQVQA